MKNKMTFGIILAFVLIASISFTYAYFSIIVQGSGTLTTVNTGTLELTYVDSLEISRSRFMPGDVVNKEIRVTNTGSLYTYYAIEWKNLLNEITNDELVMSMSCVRYSGYGTGSQAVSGSCTGLSETIVPTEVSTIKENIFIESGITHVYVINLTFKNVSQNQSYNEGKEFNGLINISESGAGSWFNTCNEDSEDLKCNLIVDNPSIETGSSEYVTALSGIDYNAASSDMNGKGLYYTDNKDKTDEDGDGVGNRIYFYRGNVVDNNVIFAGFCWRIVRTTENGNIKLRYNGVPDSGVCPQTGTDISLTTLAFNEGNDQNAYVGYMYGTPGANTYAEEHANTNDSTIKEYLDTWYEENIVPKGEAVLSKIANTIYCNDRSLATFITDEYYKNGTGIAQIPTMYSSPRRNIYNGSTWGNVGTPSYSCYAKNDRFTLSVGSGGTLNYGNNKLTYPIGLLTGDEVAFAGGGHYANNSYYLYTSASYWTMSPCDMTYLSTNLYVFSMGVLIEGGTTSEQFGVVPVIALNSNVRASSGFGSYTNPYVIE